MKCPVKVLNARYGLFIVCFDGTDELEQDVPNVYCDLELPRALIL